MFDIMSNEPVIADEPGPGLTYREKTLWVTGGSTLAVYAYYFCRVLAIGDGDPARVGVLFGSAIVVLIIVQIAANIVLAAQRRPERTDERDRRVAVKAARNAYYVLMTGVWGAVGLIAVAATPFWVAHAALLGLVVAELTRCGSQLVYYRRGA